MASYLQIENISKSYGPKVLFENIGFNINEGDKIALIAPNGTGKTSLLRILAGKDKSDSGGKIMFLRHIRIAFLEQEYDFDPGKGIFEQVMDGSRKWTKDLDHEAYFEYELRVRTLLTNFKLTDFDKKMGLLSGGEVKRVALTEMLASEADFFIMDEPTNHLDIDAIEFLEGYLSRARCTLLMVTHDRYFLDRVCNTVIEMDHGAVYQYKGDYENYLEKREERIANFNANTDKVRNILRRELEWMRSTPCARSGKAKYRKDAFYELKERAEQTLRYNTVKMDELSDGSRLGTKIIDCKNVTFSYGDRVMLKDFSYKFQRFEKIGIVGANGVGKTTFINLLLGNKMGDDGVLTGSIERGESLKIGYYSQSGMSFDEDQTVLETVNDTHLLSMFMFPHDMLNNKISKLSGGEKRRLYLLTILMQNPNLLIMDEPTNDLDVVTLNVLEEYLLGFKGSLIIVSHDRHFLDRIVDHLLIFMGDGRTKDYYGPYSEYREYVKAQLAQTKPASKEKASIQKSDAKPAQKEKKKLSYKEQREFEQLEKDIESLTAEKEQLEVSLSGGETDYGKISELTARYSEVKDLLDEKELRWLELSEQA